MLFNERPSKARADAWIAIAASTIASAAAIGCGSPSGWLAGGIGATLGGAIALRRSSEMERSLAVSLTQNAIADRAEIGAFTHLMRPMRVAKALQLAAAETPDPPPEPIAEPSEPGPLTQAEWYPQILEAQFLLICGPQGSGKTSLCAQILRDRLDLGHQISALDPHAAYGQYPSQVDVIGAGKRYDEIDDAIARFIEQIKSHYQAIAVRPMPTPRPETLILEELTQWAKQCKRSPELIAVACSDIRKAGKFVLAISHGRTLNTLGGAKGYRGTLDQGITTLELDAKDGPNGRPIPALTGRLYRPGQPNHAIAITLDNTPPTPVTIVAPPPPTEAPNPAIAALEKAWNLPAQEPDNNRQNELIDLVIAIAQKRKRPITAADCSRGSRKLKALGPDGIRELFYQAKVLGKGEVSEGKFIAR